jgi:hypothetical protein
VELHFDVEKGHITRTQVFTDSLNPAPLEALAARCRAVSIGRICCSRSVKRWCGFPGAGKELRSCRRGLPARCADKSRMAATPGLRCTATRRQSRRSATGTKFTLYRPAERIPARF